MAQRAAQASPESNFEEEQKLFRLVISGDQAAWKQLVRRFQASLREVVRESTDAIHPLTRAEIDDVMGDFWLRLVDANMRCLRTFRGGGASLLAFLRFQVLEVAHEHVRRLGDEPSFVPLDEARHVPEVHEPSSSRRAASDLSGLAALLQLPTEMHAIRAELGQLRSAFDQLRRALPPALLSVGDAARALGVSTVTVRRMVRTGRLAHVRLGRSVKVNLTRTPVESTNADDGVRAALLLRR